MLVTAELVIPNLISIALSHADEMRSPVVQVVKEVGNDAPAPNETGPTEGPVELPIRRSTARLKMEKIVFIRL